MSAKSHMISRIKKQEIFDNKEWYTIRSILGNDWAMFFLLLGGRERGKSYDVMDYCIRGWKKKKRQFTWMRLSEPSARKMLNNNASKMVDPDIMRKYDLKLTTKGVDVFDHDEKMAKVLCVSTAYNDKGVAFFDKDYKGELLIVLDEFQLEKGQKRTFDVAYNLVVQLENLVRSRKNNVRIIMIGNTLEEVSDILAMFNFIPPTFGVYKLKSKRCVIDYIPNNKAYVKRRKGTVGDILAGESSNYTNEIKNDLSLIEKGRLRHPQYVIKFGKGQEDWYTVWEGNIIDRFHGEFNPNSKKKIKFPSIAMLRYLDDNYNSEKASNVIEQFDARAYKFKSLMCQKKFAYQLSLVKPK